MVVSLTNSNKNILAINLTNEMLKSNYRPVFLCVGSEKVAGDMLGALVGESIKKYNLNAYVYGCLGSNVDNSNLQKTINDIKQKHPYNPIILVDGVLSELSEVGSVKYYPHGSYAGGQYNDGVFVGDYSILAVVGASGMDSLTLLKSVKLKSVINMAQFISQSIKRAFDFSMCLLQNNEN